MRQWDGLISLWICDLTFFIIFKCTFFIGSDYFAVNRLTIFTQPGYLVLLSSSSFAGFRISVQTTQNGASWQNLG